MPFLALALAPRPALAQTALMARCATVSDLQWNCAALAQAAMIAQARLGLAAAGGNPLAGSASTLGMRLGSTPRVSAQLRVTGTRFTLPSPQATGSANLSSPGNPPLTASPHGLALAADAGVGLYRGASPLPTVGGVGSLDLFASLGVLANPGSGFHGSAATGALGARLGLLRESFTTPGITVSAAYRRIGSMSSGEASPPSPAQGLGSFGLGSTGDWSLRGVVGKRLFFLGTSAGVGLDRYSAQVTEARGCPAGALCTANFVPLSVSASLTQTRGNAFADLTWTSLVFNATAEVGWQKGGTPATAAVATGYESLVRKSGIFGSLALRLTI